MLPVTGVATGWDAWSADEAQAAREHHDRREARLARERDAAEARAAARRTAGHAGTQAPAAQTAAAPHNAAAATAPVDDPEAKKRAIIQAALERARKKKEELAAKGAGPQNTERVSADVQAQIDAAEPRRRRLGIEGGAEGDAPATTPHTPKP